jgi:nucleotide-binding universal stress UspA family protein
MNEPATRADDPLIRNVLVPLDGSAFAARTLAPAGALAARVGATLHTVTVTTSEFEIERIRKEAASVLATDADDPRIHVVVGYDVAGAIHELVDALDACLPYVATHGHNPAVGALMGSTARSVVERARGPVVAAGPSALPNEQAHTMPGARTATDLIACVDGSAESERVLPVAASWARALDLHMSILTVAEPIPPPARAGGQWWRRHGPPTDADEYIRQLVDRWSTAAPGVRGDVVYDPIGVAPGITEYLANHPAGLLAVGVHRRQGLERIFVGATTASIVHAASPPVLVVATP